MDEQCLLVTLDQLVTARPFLTPRWVRSMVASERPEPERFPHYKVGGKLVFDLEEVDAFVRRDHRGAIETPSEPEPDLGRGTVAGAESAMVRCRPPPGPDAVRGPC